MGTFILSDVHLKQSNNSYHDIETALDNMPRKLLALTGNTNDQQPDSSNLLQER